MSDYKSNVSLNNDDASPRNSPVIVAAARWDSHERDLTFLDHWRVVKRWKWLILSWVFISVVGTFLITQLMTKKYKAQVTLMPLSISSGGFSGLASQLGSIPLLGGQLSSLTGMGGGKTKELVNILKSRTIAETIVAKFGLMNFIFADLWEPAKKQYRPNWRGWVPVEEDAVKIFQKRISTVEEDKKTGMVKISVNLSDPELAAKIANAMVLELQTFIEKNSVTVSKRNRIFIEEQLVKNGARLLDAGKELNNFYSRNKVSGVFPQVDVRVGSFQTMPPPFEEIEINGEAGARKAENEMNEVATVSQVPSQIYLQYLTLNRELIAKAHALLSQQYEVAKIEEAKEDLAFQVIDRANVKVRPTSPDLKINLAAAFVFGLFSSIMAAFFIEHLRSLKQKESVGHP